MLKIITKSIKLSFVLKIVIVYKNILIISLLVLIVFKLFTFFLNNKKLLKIENTVFSFEVDIINWFSYL